VRNDLPHPHQVVQACHACIEATRAFLPSDHEHPFLVICGVRDERRLGHCRDRLDRAGIRYRAFFEPDLGNQLTALASEPLRGARRDFFRHCPLLSDNG
jgi:hypothetical protein